jgi:hypothetical protein
MKCYILADFDYCIFHNKFSICGHAHFLCSFVTKREGDTTPFRQPDLLNVTVQSLMLNYSRTIDLLWHLASRHPPELQRSYIDAAFVHKLGRSYSQNQNSRSLLVIVLQNTNFLATDLFIQIKRVTPHSPSDQGAKRSSRSMESLTLNLSDCNNMILLPY